VEEVSDVARELREDWRAKRRTIPGGQDLWQNQKSKSGGEMKRGKRVAIIMTRAGA
jgi:hypothetical protein